MDFENARRYIIGEDVVRSLSLNMIADSSAYYDHEQNNPVAIRITSYNSNY